MNHFPVIGIVKITHVPTGIFIFGVSKDCVSYIRKIKGRLEKRQMRDCRFKECFDSVDNLHVNIEPFLRLEDAKFELHCREKDYLLSDFYGGAEGAEVRPVLNGTIISKLSATYRITHIPSGYFYIGSTNNLLQRLREHYSKLTRGIHPTVKFQKVFDEWKNLRIEYFAVNDDKLISEEQNLLDRHFNDPFCCNMSDKSLGNTSGKGVPKTEEHRRRISLGQMGRVSASRKEVKIDGVSYPSVTHAARQYGISNEAVKRRITGRIKGYPGWEFV